MLVTKNFRKPFLGTLVAAATFTPAMSYAFLDALKKNIESLGGKTSAPSGQTSIAGSSNQKPAQGSVDAICSRVLGPPYEGKFPPGVSAEDLVGRYFNVTVDLGLKLRQGISVIRPGAMPNMEHMLRDLNDMEARRLGEAFVRSPTVINLGHIVNLSERGDAYTPENAPSQRTEARTLLGLVLMQYPDLVKTPGQAAVIFRENFTRDSGLSIAMLARMHLFGDGLAKDLSAFSNYVGQASSKYQVHINDQTIFYALDRLPNWSQANQYRSLIQSSKDMAASFNRSRKASAAAPAIRKQALFLMAKGEEIDGLTLEALGAGPTVAQLRARGERMRKEATGEANLIAVSVTTSDEYRQEFNRLLLSAPKISDEAKKKLANANKLRLENVNETYRVAGQIALLFFNGNIAETQEIGGYVNAYFRNSCESTFRTIQFAREAGEPPPTVQINRDSEL
jgi:hypothetical protein